MKGHLPGGLRAVAAGIVRHLPAEPAVGRLGLDGLRQVLVSGISVTGPLVVTLLVVGVAVDFVAGVLEPFVRVLTFLGLTGGHGGLVAQGLTVTVLFGVVFLAGVLAETGPTAGAVRGFGRYVEAVPGVGSVYSSFDQMSDVMLESDAGGFREVKLVEFPHSDIYSLAFTTSEVTGADGERLLVLFVPLAPNPVMGGFMVCVPDHRVRDVDMTVQEAFQAIITSGVAMSTTAPS